MFYFILHFVRKERKKHCQKECRSKERTKQDYGWSSHAYQISFHEPKKMPPEIIFNMALENDHVQFSEKLCFA